MISPEERLIRAQRRTIRNLESEVEYLKALHWDETHPCNDPDCSHGEVEIPVQVERVEEATGKTDVDSFVKSLLEL